ncbi:ATP synthase F1 subunit gamma [Patescibacteria group bacterium]|nr:ATP synthase F1 subunit gamma [Patescibacteria group bacterium]
MPIATREIKRRIRSVTNTKKITKAMELVAAAKMRKAVNAVLATRSYANSAWDIVKSLSVKTDPSLHPLLQKRKQVKNVGLILITSNRGLCGSFNRDIIETVARYIRNHKSEHVDIEAEVFLMGSKGRDIMFKHGHKVVAEFAKLDVTTRISEISPIAKMVITDFINGKYDKISIAYTDYQSAIIQRSRVRKLLPIEREDRELGYVGDTYKDDLPDSRSETETPGLNADFEYLFEPSPDAVLEQMLNRLIELQVYQDILESNASEHSARMLAMRNATDAAGDMIDDLTLTFNQARQQAITSELADISAGSAAVR